MARGVGDYRGVRMHGVFGGVHVVMCALVCGWVNVSECMCVWLWLCIWVCVGMSSCVCVYWYEKYKVRSRRQMKPKVLIE